MSLHRSRPGMSPCSRSHTAHSHGRMVRRINHRMLHRNNRRMGPRSSNRMLRRSSNRMLHRNNRRMGPRSNNRMLRRSNRFTARRSNNRMVRHNNRMLHRSNSHMARYSDNSLTARPSHTHRRNNLMVPRNNLTARHSDSSPMARHSNSPSPIPQGSCSPIRRSMTRTLDSRLFTLPLLARLLILRTRVSTKKVLQGRTCLSIICPSLSRTPT